MIEISNMYFSGLNIFHDVWGEGEQKKQNWIINTDYLNIKSTT